MASDYEISVIIPTFSAWDSLRKCLESIAKDADQPAHEVIVVFNSPVPSDLKLTDHHSRARAIQNDRNYGFAEACNAGAIEAVGETLVFLNDDMFVSPGWMTALTAPLNDNGRAASGGRILTSDGKKIDFAGSSINMLGWGFQRGRGDPVSAADDEFGSPSRLPFACGGNFAIRAGIYEEAGGFDNDYFAYYEDVDLGWRLRLMGHEIAYVADAVVHHEGGLTGSQLTKQLKWYLQERNALQTIIKNYSDDLLGKILPIAFALVSVRSQVLSLIELDNLSPDKNWRNWILHDFKRPEKDHDAGLSGLFEHMKDSAKAGLKALKGSTTLGWEESETYAHAGLFALEWVLQHWDRLLAKREKIQEKRTVSDRDLLPLFDDLLRPVLGHPREVEAMKPLEDILNTLMGEA